MKPRLTGRIHRSRRLPRILGNLGLVLGEGGAAIDGRVGTVIEAPLSAARPQKKRSRKTHIEISYEAVLAGVWPLINRFHASLHS